MLQLAGKIVQSFPLVIGGETALAPEPAPLEEPGINYKLLAIILIIILIIVIAYKVIRKKRKNNIPKSPSNTTN